MRLLIIGAIFVYGIYAGITYVMQHTVIAQLDSLRTKYEHGVQLADEISIGSQY